MSTALTAEIRAWLATEWPTASPRRREQLVKLAEHVKCAQQHASSGGLPVGSFRRQIANRHEHKLASEAMRLGFHPPEEELKELGLHIAGQSLGLSL